MNNYSLKNKLKIARAEKDLSQEKLADLVGVSRQTINAIERGDYNPSTLLSFTIAKALDKDINDIFYITNNEESN
jgi:putative transcriptional regulator